jgi:hypothetical protein
MPYMAVSTVNQQTGSYMENGPTGPNTVYNAPGLPSVTEEQCNAAKCGAVTLDALSLQACSANYGPGVWSRCTDSRCLPYRGNSCTSNGIVVPTPPPTIANPNQVLTPGNLAAPVPDITVTPPATVQYASEPGPVCRVNTWITDNPLLAVGLLGAFFVVTHGGKRGEQRTVARTRMGGTRVGARVVQKRRK